MPARPITRRRLFVTLNPVSLIGCIALGLWLGCVAIALTTWLVIGAVGPTALTPFSQAMSPVITAPAVVQPSTPSNVMFGQYQQNLYQSEQQQRLENPRSSYRNASNPSCQFWLQQNQNAPTDKSRANVLRFCN